MVPSASIKDDMSLEGFACGEPQSNAEKLAVYNAAANTTTSKSIKLLNTTNPIPTILSLHHLMFRSTSATSVLEMLWRALAPYKTSQDIDKVLLAIPPVWTLFSPTIVYSPTI